MAVEPEQVSKVLADTQHFISLVKEMVGHVEDLTDAVKEVLGQWEHREPLQDRTAERLIAILERMEGGSYRPPSGEILVVPEPKKELN